MRKKYIVIIVAVVLVGSITISLLGIGDFTIRLHFSRGNVLAEKGQIANAVAEFEKGADYGPTEVEAYSNIANLYAFINQWDEAIIFIDKGLALDPNNYFLNDLKARYYIYTNEMDKALDYCNTAISYGANFASALQTRAVIDFKLGNYAVLNDCNKILLLFPDNVPAYMVRGLFYAQLGGSSFAASIYDFTKVIQLDPGNAVAYYNRGLAYKYQGNNAAAEADFAQVPNLTNDPSILKYLETEIGYILPIY
jgi:tetratricopeptide (TPR) repeat protein